MLSDTGEMPPWKKELILRLRSKSAQLAATPQTASSGVHEPSAPPATCSASDSPSSCSNSSSSSSSSSNGLAEPRVGAVQCNSSPTAAVGNKMVQERIWAMDRDGASERSTDSDSSEELKYGPGIVSKLKNRYLSLTLREAAMKSRPSILNMRKAASLEHILDKDEPHKRDFQQYNINGHSKHIPTRYRSAARKPDMKRARSVEYISNAASNDDNNAIVDAKPKRESLHEDMLSANRKEEVDKRNEINDIKTFSNNLNTKVNRPKRLQPIMTEKEKPPLDVVKHTKLFFERPEFRTKSPIQTGDVAAKVATFKEIIETKKPPLKQKPACIPSNNAAKPNNNNKEICRNKPAKEKPIKITPTVPTLRSPVAKPTPTVLSSPPITAKKVLIKPPAENLQNSLPTSPIPDVSLVELPEANENRKSSLSETPDLIPHSSQNKPQTPEDDPEITIKTNGFANQAGSATNSASSSDEDVHTKKIPQNLNLDNSMVFDFSSKPKIPNYLPVSQNNQKEKSSPKLKRSSPATPAIPKAPPKLRQKPLPPLTVNVPITEPLKVEITTTETTTSPKKPLPNNASSPPPPPPPPLQQQHPQHVPLPQTTNNKKEPKQQQRAAPDNVAKPPKEKPAIRDIVIEKNLKNAAKSSESVAKSPQQPVEKGAEGAKNDNVMMSVLKVTKRAPRKPEQQNCLVFDFTTRKDVPDYVGNDGRIKTGKIEKPKPGEGGFTLLPGATLDESLIDDDEDWKKSLEGPPSPLLVTFVNDNVLIDGKSSLSQKTKRPKMSIKFVECEPDIFMYPSESSVIGDESQVTQLTTNSNSVGHSVPSLSGSSLANYKSKTAHQIEDFQLGMKPTTQTTNTSPISEKKLDNHNQEEESNEDSYQPIAFSAGTNTDILF